MKYAFVGDQGYFVQKYPYILACSTYSLYEISLYPKIWKCVPNCKRFDRICPSSHFPHCSNVIQNETLHSNEEQREEKRIKMFVQSGWEFSTLKKKMKMRILDLEETQKVEKNLLGKEFKKRLSKKLDNWNRVFEIF